MPIQFKDPPKSICILRLSAIGDICHVLPVIRTLQEKWPTTKLTWIIGKTEYSLVSDIEGIEFIIFDKKQKLASFSKVRKQLAGHKFDLLLHMQMSLRASMLSLLIKAKYRLGFDRKRAKDLQWLFTNKKIDFQPNQHVIDSFFGFTEAVGIDEPSLKWDIPIPDDAHAYANNLLNTLNNDERNSKDKPTRPYLIISPCSSMEYRNWLIERYAAVADYAYSHHAIDIVLTGGPSKIEKYYAEQISANMNSPALNLVGKTNLKQLLALIKQAVAVISPDAGPAHLATAVSTPVIGLYATTNPDRARPYLSAEFVVNKYPEAIQAKLGKSVRDVTWGTRVRDEGTMARISVDEVIQMLDHLLGSRLD